MRFVARLWGYRYEGGVEIRELCWLGKSGACETKGSAAQVYESEADAWAHLRATNNIGSDARGSFSFVEAA